MFYNIFIFWWPILTSMIFIILQVEVSLKNKLPFSILVTVLYTLFMIFIILVVTSFDFYIILILICMYFWFISISVYVANRRI